MSPSLPQTLTQESPLRAEIGGRIARQIQFGNAGDVEKLTDAFIQVLRHHLRANAPLNNEAASYPDNEEAWAAVREMFTTKYVRPDITWDGEVEWSAISMAVLNTLDTFWPAEHPPLVIHRWVYGQTLQTLAGQSYTATGHNCNECDLPLVFGRQGEHQCLDTAIANHKVND